MPSNPIPRFLGKSSGAGQAALYVKMCGSMWRGTPGALDFIKKVRNTQQAATLLSEASSGRPLQAAQLRRYVEGVSGWVVWVG